MTIQRALEIIKDKIPFESSIINEAFEVIEKALEKQTVLKTAQSTLEPPYNIGDTAYFIWNYNEPEIQECKIKEF